MTDEKLKELKEWLSKEREILIKQYCGADPRFKGYPFSTVIRVYINFLEKIEELENEF